MNDLVKKYIEYAKEKSKNTVFGFFTICKW